MKVVILAGGLGSRLSEETTVKPKPMVEIGGRPILWHIMKLYSSFGLNDFIICLGYKGYVIKEYFANYRLHNSNVTFDLVNDTVEVHDHKCEPWKVTLLDTGDESMTGGRLKYTAPFVGNEDFCLTYGDGLSNVDISALIKFHKSHGKHATVTAVPSPSRFGALKMSGKSVQSFEEKPLLESGYINGGFFVLSPEVFPLIKGDSTVWEQEPLRNLAQSGQLNAFTHDGFWQPMDTLREKNHLEKLWKDGKAPWKLWE